MTCRARLGCAPRECAGFQDIELHHLYRTEQTELRRRGYLRDRMPDYPQVVICLVVDRDGWPIPWDLLPGNTADGADAP